MKFLANFKFHIAVAVFAAAFPWLVNFFVLHWPFRCAGKADVWIGFWGSYFGGILTIAGVFIALRANMKVYEKQINNDRASRDQVNLESIIQRIRLVNDYSRRGGLYMVPLNSTQDSQEEMVNRATIASDNRWEYLGNLEAAERLPFSPKLKLEIRKLIDQCEFAINEWHDFEVDVIVNKKIRNPIEQFVRLQRLQAVAGNTCAAISKFTEESIQ
jgi:hypothetical protein